MTYNGNGQMTRTGGNAGLGFFGRNMVRTLATVITRQGANGNTDENPLFVTTVNNALNNRTQNQNNFGLNNMGIRNNTTTTTPITLANIPSVQQAMDELERLKNHVENPQNTVSSSVLKNQNNTTTTTPTTNTTDINNNIQNSTKQVPTQFSKIYNIDEERSEEPLNIVETMKTDPKASKRVGFINKPIIDQKIKKKDYLCNRYN